jgi:hypothetical protein
MQQPLARIFQTLIWHEVLVIDQLWTQARVYVSVATCHGNTIIIEFDMIPITFS